MQKVLIVTCLFFIFSCEEIAIPINEVVISPTEKVVLIEDLTGTNCSNCPKGTKVIENILTKYPKNAIAVGIHGSFLSDPVRAGDPDFRNEDAKNLENWFKPWFGKPSASVNRQKDGNYFVNDSPDLWQSLVETELEKPLEMNLFMDVQFDENSRNVKIEIAANPVTDLSGDYNITVFVLESHIIAGQNNGGVIIDEYEHNHVLRKTITHFSGDFFSNDLQQNQIYKKNYNYTLPVEEDKLNKAENTSIVAFVHKSGTTTREVVQAVEKYLKE